jgi:hypothetical protein
MFRFLYKAIFRLPFKMFCDIQLAMSLKYEILFTFMVGLCPWVNQDKANNWRPPFPRWIKNLPHAWTTMRQQRYGGEAEMWPVRAMHTFSCTDISGAMLQFYVLTCGRSVTAFSAPSRSRRPGQGLRSSHPKASPVYIRIWDMKMRYKNVQYNYTII